VERAGDRPPDPMLTALICPWSIRL